MLRSVLSVLLAAALLFTLCVPAGGAYAPGVSASCAVLTDAQSGEILYGRNENRRAEPASLTKIMTAIVVIENCGVTKEATVPKEAVGVEGSSAYLSEGEVFTVEELLYALLLQSANDAAVALAIYCGGSVEDFVIKMNGKAGELGLSNTHFANPHGLPDKDHFSSALDMAKLLTYCMQNAVFARICGAREYVIKPGERRKGRQFTNHNRLLFEDAGVTGGKTGYTRSGGRCLCTFAEHRGVKLCAVTLNAPDDWADHRTLYEYGFGLYKPVTLGCAGVYELHIVGGVKDTVTASVYEDKTVYLKDGDTVTKAVYMRRFEYAPVYEGERIGSVVFTCGERTVYTVPLYADITSTKKSTGFF